MGKHTKYTAEFKQQAVAAIIEGKKTVTELARELGMSRPLLYKWHERHLEKAKMEINSSTVPSQLDCLDCHKMIKQQQSEIIFLKRACAYFAKHSNILE